MRVGLIGLQGHHGVALKGMAELGKWQLVAASDDHAQDLADFIRSEPLAREAQPYADWRQLIEHTMMDVCVVGDENGRRIDQLLALIERNIDIVSEKPLTTSLADLDRLERALAKSKSRLTMLLTMRHEPQYAHLRKLVQEGVIGQVQLATAQKSYRLGSRPEWQKTRERLGGIIPYIGIHAIDQMRWTSGLDYKQVAAFHANLDRPQMGETESQASVLLEFTNGGSATARLDYLRPATAPTHGDDRLRLAGSRGVIETGSRDKSIMLITDDEGPRSIQPPPTPNLFTSFIKALQNGEPFRIPTADCLAMTRIVLHAREAADAGKVVKL